MTKTKSPPGRKPDDRLTTTRIHTEYGITVKDWNARLFREQVPQPVEPNGGVEGISGKKWWYRRAVEAYLDGRGVGIRNDVAARLGLTEEQIQAINDAIACPQCGEARHRPCTTPSGRLSAAPHGRRIAQSGVLDGAAA